MSITWNEVAGVAVALATPQVVRFGGMEIPESDLLQAIGGSFIASAFAAGFGFFGSHQRSWLAPIINTLLGVLVGVAIANLLVLTPLFETNALVALSVLLSLGSAKLARRWISDDAAFDAIFKKIWPGK